MKNFLAIYTGTPASSEKWNELDETQRKQREAEGMKAWGEWLERHQAHIVTEGGPLGKTKRADRNGITDIKNEMVAFVIVKAESHQAAAQMFANHPHFSIFPGDAVEIMECLPMPRQ